MALHPLDAKIAIVEAFDSGRLARQANTQEIAQAVGVGIKRIPRIVRSTNFSVVKIRRPNSVKVPARWAPPP